MLLTIGSYTLDWVLLIALAVVGYIVGDLPPRGRPFRIDNPDISLPYNGDTVAISTAFIVSVPVPALIILAISLALRPPPLPAARFKRGGKANNPWRRKLWEAHSGVLGLLLSVVISWFVASGLKNLLGKPRPNFLARCQPDLSEEALASMVVGVNKAYTSSNLYDVSICTNEDRGMVQEGLRSFPSGHSSVAAAGLVYLTIWFLGRFTILTALSTFFRPQQHRGDTADEEGEQRAAGPMNLSSSTEYDGASTLNGGEGDVEEGGRRLPRNVAHAVDTELSAPPAYLTMLALVPAGTAMFIGGSRWFDFQHHGFDIISSFFLGVASSIFAYIMYHQVRQDGGPAFGRASRRSGYAFWIQETRGGVSTERKSSKKWSSSRSGTGTLGGRTRDEESGEWIHLTNTPQRQE